MCSIEKKQDVNLCSWHTWYHILSIRKAILQNSSLICINAGILCSCGRTKIKGDVRTTVWWTWSGSDQDLFRYHGKNRYQNLRSLSSYVHIEAKPLCIAHKNPQAKLCTVSARKALTWTVLLFINLLWFELEPSHVYLSASWKAKLGHDGQFSKLRCMRSATGLNWANYWSCISILCHNIQLV